MHTNSGYRSQVTQLKTAKKHKPSSNKWLKRQINDSYVAKSKLDGYRSRSAYKMIDINDKFHIFKAGMQVIDLGAAPGGWSQVASKLIKAKHGENPIIALDLLEMHPIDNVITIQANFLEPEGISAIENAIQEISTQKSTDEVTHGDHQVDIVMSDMAANTTGHSTTDHLRTMVLCEQAFEFSLKFLKPGGHFIAKIFQGGAENELLNRIKTQFTTVKHFKPASSRKESSEFYLIALNKKP